MQPLTQADRNLFDQVIQKYGIVGIMPTDENIRAVRLLYKVKPLVLLGISAELSDGRFSKYLHGKRATYVNHKCHGTLCTHANKMHARERKNLDRLYDGIDQALDTLCESLETGILQ